MAIPPQGKSFEQFQSEDGYCHEAATYASGGGPAAQQATNNAVGSAVVGTALGAAAGALIGSAGGAAGAGAAIGAGAGLLAGSAVGANGAQATSYDLQRAYDMTYAQCMLSKGNQIAQAPQPQPYYAPQVDYVGPPIVVGDPYYYYGYGPRYYRRW
jgi:hypothetical protein